MRREQPGIQRDNLSDDEGDEDGMFDNESEDQSQSAAESSDDVEAHLDRLSSQSEVDRRRSLQLEKSETMSSEVAPSKTLNAFSEIMHYGGKVSKRFVNLVIWLPTDLSLSLSKGFHNAPKLYHDPMVQATPKVIGIRSGFRAAGKVFSTSISFLTLVLTHNRNSAMDSTMALLDLSLSLAMVISTRAPKACSKASAKASVEFSLSHQPVCNVLSILERLVPEDYWC